MKKTLYILVSIALMSCSCSGGDYEKYTPPSGGNGNGNGGNKPQETVCLYERATEMLDIVNRNFQYTLKGKKLYHEELGGSDASFLWPYVGMMSGINALYKVGCNVPLEEMTDNFSVYWRASGNNCNLPGFGSSTNGENGGGTRFYDDNAIAGIEYVQAYQSLHKQAYLDRCGDIYAFLSDAVDDTMAKALWWNEDQKNQPGVGDSNKPSCANGYATKFLLMYYNICPDNQKADVLALAKDLYNYLYTTLRDPSDNCYWNDKNADGSINTTKWTYNTGVMIENGVMLYEITKENSYLDQAKASATGSYGYFIKSRNGLNRAWPDHDPWFNGKLCLGYIALAPYWSTVKDYINSYKTYVENGWKKARTNEELFYEDWGGQKQGRYSQLLQQVAVIEAYGILSLYYGEEKR